MSRFSRKASPSRVLLIIFATILACLERRWLACAPKPRRKRDFSRQLRIVAMVSPESENRYDRQQAGSGSGTLARAPGGCRN
jgi:hypothetical protein